MEKFALKVESRETKKPNQLRRAGKIPATLYGPGVSSKNIQVEAKELYKLPQAAYSHIIDLKNGQGESIAAIIRHVQRKPATHEVLNIEFYRVAADRKLTTVVPLKFVGISPAQLAGGHLTEVYQEAQVECFPSDIPDFIEVDLSVLAEIDQGIHFSELQVHKNVKILNPPEEIVARVVAIRVVVEEAAERPAAATEAAITPAATGSPPTT